MIDKFTQVDFLTYTLLVYNFHLDIGLWTIDGNLQIIDRKKNIFKLSQGEYVAPEKIENVLTQSLIISQAFVYGDSLQNSLVAIIIPEEEPVRALLESLGEAALAKCSFSNICNNEKLKSIIIADMKRVGKSNGLHSFECVALIAQH